MCQEEQPLIPLRVKYAITITITMPTVHQHSNDFYNHLFSFDIQFRFDKTLKKHRWYFGLGNYLLLRIMMIYSLVLSLACSLAHTMNKLLKIINQYFMNSGSIEMLINPNCRNDQLIVAECLLD